MTEDEAFEERSDAPTAFPGFAALSEDEGCRELIGRLLELRKERGLTQTEVAAKMGTSQSALARIEAGRSDVRLSTVARYAAAVDADIGFAVRSRDRRAR